MAEQPKQKPRESDEAPPPAAKSRSLVTLGLFGGVMLIEGLAIFFCMKFFGNEPDPTLGAEGLTPATQPWTETVELTVADLRVHNRNASRPMLYSVKIVVTVHHSNKQKMEDFLKNRASTIEDAMSRVLRSADETLMNEPGLESLRRQLRFELNTLIGDDNTIEKVLVPSFTPLPAGF